MSELRQRMLADLRIRNYAERTQGIYVRRVVEMVRHFERSLEKLTKEEVRDYLRQLKEGRRVSRSAFAQVIGALRIVSTLPETPRVGRPSRVECGNNP